MTPLEKALAPLIGRDPTTEEMAKLYKIKEACGFSDHDSVWTLLAAFGHYEILYRDIPKEIAEQGIKTIAEHKLALEASASAAERAIKSNLIDSVRETTAKLIDEAQRSSNALAAIRERRGLLVGTLVSIGVAFLALLVVGYLGFKIGANTAGAHAAWSQSSEGVAARKFAQMNQVSTMLSCPSPYQTHRDGAATYCIPYDAQAKKSWGWRIN